MDEKQTEELSLEQAVATLVSELPEPVQAFVTGPERDRVVASLSQKYHLHADQAGAFQRAFIFMLLGIATPDKFVNTLKEEGLTEDIVAGLTNDVNQQVFMRLREEEEAQSRKVAAPAPQPVQQEPRKPEPLPTPSLVKEEPELALPQAPHAPELAGPSVNQFAEREPVTLPGSPVIAPMPETPNPVPPAASAPEIVPEAAPVAAVPLPGTAAARPPIRTMQGDMEALRASGLEKASVPGARTAPTPAPAPAPSAYEAARPEPIVRGVTSEPFSAPAQQPQRAFMHEDPIPLVTPPPRPAQMPVPKAPAASPSVPLTKDYGVDPYREPVE